MIPIVVDDTKLCNECDEVVTYFDDICSNCQSAIDWDSFFTWQEEGNEDD